MTTLLCTNPPQFFSTGSDDFPVGVYTLEGKFPLDWNDLYEHTGKLHTLNGKKVKVTGFIKICRKGEYLCYITVETNGLKLEPLENMDLNSIIVELS